MVVSGDGADRRIVGTSLEVVSEQARRTIAKKSPKCTLRLGALATLVFPSETPVTRFARDRNALVG